MDELSDEDIQKLIALGIIPDKQNDIQDQLKLAEKLRYGPNSMPQMRQTGQVATAANPLEFLAYGMQGYRAGQDIKELRKQQNNLLQEQVAGRLKYYQQLLRKPQDRMPDPNMVPDSTIPE